MAWFRLLAALALAGCADKTPTGVYRRGARPGQEDSAPGGPGGGGPGGGGGDGGSGDGGDSADSEPVTPGDSAPPAPWEMVYPDERVGIFYLTWHAYAADAYRQLEEPLTVEAVIRDTDRYFSDVLGGDLYQEAAAFHYHAQPEPGFYCLYRPRDGEAPYAEPDAAATCPDTATVAAAHAAQLWDAGVDFVYVDLTNLPAYSAFSDVLGVRPFEVLLEEWAALRAAGQPTPQVAAWVPAAALGEGQEPTWGRLLASVQDPAYADLVLRHVPTGEPVIFIVAHSADDVEVERVRAEGLLPVLLWGNLDAATLAGGVAGWMQPCAAGGAFTTWVDPDTPCDQSWSPTTPIGSVVSVSASYQIGYASLPLQASGRAGGLTLQKQFETALAARPDYLLINAWNEHIAQPQANPYDPALGGLRRSMGVTEVPEGDASADWLWVDMYGADLTRDIEPTVEGGAAAYELMASCLRVYRGGATSCDDAGEACCQLAPGWRVVYSLRAPGGGADMSTDHVPTIDAPERDALVAGGWEEVCNPHYGPPGLCGGGTTGDGPFFLFPADGPDRAALYRCFTGVDHFLTLAPGCEGTTGEGSPGWVSTVRDSETPRPLRRCYNAPAQAHFHWLDERCPAIDGVSEEAILGYVR